MRKKQKLKQSLFKKYPIGVHVVPGMLTGGISLPITGLMHHLANKRDKRQIKEALSPELLASASKKSFNIFHKELNKSNLYNKIGLKNKSFEHLTKATKKGLQANNLMRGSNDRLFTRILDHLKS